MKWPWVRWLSTSRSRQKRMNSCDTRESCLEGSSSWILILKNYLRSSISRETRKWWARWMSRRDGPWIVRPINCVGLKFGRLVWILRSVNGLRRIWKAWEIALSCHNSSLYSSSIRRNWQTPKVLWSISSKYWNRIIQAKNLWGLFVIMHLALDQGDWEQIFS